MCQRSKVPPEAVQVSGFGCQKKDAMQNLMVLIKFVVLTPEH